jgi:hypothetical protein
MLPWPSAPKEGKVGRAGRVDRRGCYPASLLSRPSTPEKGVAGRLGEGLAAVDHPVTTSDALLQP